MATAAIYGLLASSSFVVGVLLGLATKPPRRLLAVVIAFGAGVLVSALTFDLMGEAFERETGAYAIGGFLVGAVIYVRVSDPRQAENLSLGTQLQACEDYCRRQGFEVLERFKEQGESAKTADRTELQRLLQYCRTHRGKCISSSSSI